MIVQLLVLAVLVFLCGLCAIVEALFGATWGPLALVLVTAVAFVGQQLKQTNTVAMKVGIKKAKVA
jgi:hypothetical protein